MRNALLGALRPLLATLVGLGLGVAATAFAGENPLTVLGLIFTGAFGSSYDLGMTLFYATPLVFTGLAVALPFHAGLFNIGAEGQLTMGALAVAALGALVPGLGPVTALAASALVAALAGALWGAVPGWLRAYRGGHEVISTIMLNFIAAGISGWVVLYIIKSTDSQNPESARIGAGYILAKIASFDGAPVTVASWLALAIALVLWALLARTARGFEITASGANPDAAKASGIDVAKTRVFAMAAGGAVAGLVGLAEVLGNAERFRIGFSPDYGFIGIPVALLARCHPAGVVLGALLFGALQRGTSGLELETDHVTRDLSSIIQALVILCVSVEGFWTMRRRVVARKAAANG